MKKVELILSIVGFCILLACFIHAIVIVFTNQTVNPEAYVVATSWGPMYFLAEIINSINKNK